MIKPMDPAPLGSSRRRIMAAGAALVLAPVGAVQARSDAGLRPPGASGFDFLLGAWTVRHRKLRHRLAGSRDWDEFPGALDVRRILGGLGDIDDNLIEDPSGRFAASSLRVFDPKAATWSIYWMDARSPGLDPPLIGRFEGRVGQFYNDDVFQGRPIRVRFTYEDVGPERARWSQAFSTNGGAAWETNWTMDFADRRPPASRRAGRPCGA